MFVAQAIVTPGTYGEMIEIIGLNIPQTQFLLRFDPMAHCTTNCATECWITAKHLQLFLAIPIRKILLLA